MTDAPADPSTLGYEQARAELVAIVQQLESGGGSLDAALQLWERGEKLAQVCEQFLAGALQRVAAASAELPGAEGADKID